MDEGAGELITRLRHRVEVLEGQLGKRRVGIHDRDEFLRRAFEDAPIGMALVGLDERIAEANAALCQMLGYSREELLGKTVPDITHPDDVVKEDAPKDDMAEGTSASFTIEKRYVRGDGSLLVGRLSVSALYDEHGKPAYFIGQLEDVTRERAAEDALREREALFRALIESTSEVFCVIGVDGITRFVSPSVSELELEPHAQIGRPFELMLHPSDRSTFAAALAKILADPKAILRTSVRILRPGGGERFCDLVGHNRLEIAALTGIVLSLRDVTEQRALQTQLSQSQRLEGLGRLAGGVAHDFNNMLSVILAMTEFLADDLEPADPRREDVETIAQTATRATALTRQLLAVGRRDHGSPKAVDAHAVIEAERGLIEKLLGEDIEFGLELEAESAWIVIDPANLVQIILNLATNARDAMPRGGRFRLRTRTQAVGRSASCPELELEAIDTGVGMDAQLCEQIFDPFFTTKAPGHGTGLGLATVYGLVVQSGGRIRVDSELGTGTCFSITWAKGAIAETSAPVELSPRASGDADLLLVEDDPWVRAATERILERGGYRVTSTGEPLAALELARGGLAIDIIVTDVVMPQLSGPQLVEAIFEIRGPVPVVFVSGYAKTAQSELSTHPGFLTKPFTPEALLERVAERLAADCPNSGAGRG